MKNRPPFPKKKDANKNYFLGLLQLGFAVSSIFAALAIGYIIKNPHLLPIRTVKVTASYEHVTPQLLAKIITPSTSQGLLHIDVEDLKQELLRQPWINKVVIRRVWPDKLAVQITEQEAIGVWNKKALINAEAQIYTPPIKTFPTNLPLFQAPDDQQQAVVEEYSLFTKALAPLQLTIVEIDLDLRHAWQLKLSNGMILFLGRNDVMSHLNRFILAYPHVFVNKGSVAKTVDLRYSNGFAVDWQK